MNAKSAIKAQLIAPCGMNCGICMAYLRQKNKCPGCSGADADKSPSCARCRIKNCSNLKKHKFKYCIECDKFPCALIKHIDTRYRTRYQMSMIENLGNIRKFGIRRFVSNEKTRWRCSKCGGTICVHRGYCSVCGKKKK
jgi:hypothetical protein